ncbi:MAG TPA: VOC family protein [Acidimicrobiales bacterium]|jgi:predicted enzyme related to lactoylglutathione lyase|nr:VOC family protein [Acidimicrobiales bacterium]
MVDAVVGIRANLEVRDVAASMDFYRRTLGMEAVTTMGTPPTFAIVVAGSASLGLVEAEAPAVAGVVAVYVDVTDVAAALARCQQAGAEITMELTTHPWGMRDFVMRDPDGHQVAIGSPSPG